MAVELLWDIDGTLVTNDTTDEYLYEQAVRETLQIAEMPYRVDRHGKTDLQIVHEYLTALGAPTANAPLVQQKLRELSQAAYGVPAPTRRLLPGVRAALGQVKAAGHSNTVLTGNSRERAVLKVTSAGLPEHALNWERGHFGDLTDRRPDLAHQALRQGEQANLVPLLIGDTPADASAAAEAGIAFCGVATGAYSADTLRKGPHAAVLPDLAAGLPDLMLLLHKLSLGHC